MTEEVDLLAVEVEDILRFDDGKVVMVRGIIEQETQRVLQLSDGSDLRVPKVAAVNDPVDVAAVAAATLPTEGTTQSVLPTEGS